MGLILGLDLGVASVGFGIIEEDTYKIIDYGVRLFEEGNVDNNLKRRTMRGTRRLKSRKKNRMNAVKYALVQMGIIDDIHFELKNNIYELRVKGLSHKLTNVELANVLVNIAKHRGVSFDVVIDEEDKDSQSASSTLADNTRRLKQQNIFICELQLEKIRNGQKLRDKDNLYRTSDYEKELRKILSNQGLSLDDIEKLIAIILRRRDFSEGPGSEKFPTPYGSYRLIDNQIQHFNLIEEMRGKCSLFPDEPRIAKNTFKACLFNLLNDLNNITFVENGEKRKISKEQKLQVIKFVEEKGKITPTQLIKLLGVNKEEVKGFRVDKKDKPLLTTFDAYERMLKLNINRNFLSNHNALDQVVEILTKIVIVEKRKEEIKELNFDLTNEEIELISNLSKINGYHSFSAKAMDVLMPELLDTSCNQMEIISKNKLGKEKINLKGKTIPFADSAILSPVVVRVHRQALNVVNALRKEYGEFSAIVIETTRAKNSAEEKKNEKEEQLRFEENKKHIENFILELERNPDKVNTITKLKLRLYEEQKGKTIYSGETIDLDKLIHDPTAYEIEHIIPYSISFDNSLNNKALASHTENQDKGNKTPWGYFASGKVKGPNDTFDKFESFVESLNLSPKKKENLLTQEDITKYGNRKEFLNRNLNDTSYGIRTVMNTLKAYFKENSIPTNVFTIKGKTTHAFRSRVGLKKDRDYYIHHAVDALIIAGFKNQKVFNQAFNYITDEDSGLTYNNTTGEIIDLDNPLEDEKLLKYISNLQAIEETPDRFSYKIDTKTNRKFSDETIYSTRQYEDGEYVIKKYKDIYGQEGEKIKKLFEEGKATSLLVYRNDRPTYDLLEKIVQSYKGEKNPFAKYKEENGFIRKYSKKGNGPIIVQLKYMDGKLGNHLDISHKYENPHSKKVVLLQNKPYRTDIYLSKDGKYKFLTIRRYHIKEINGHNVIDKEKYLQLMENKGITDEDTFLFSLNRNTIIRIVNETENYYRFVATNDDERNRIEVKKIESVTEKQLILSIGKKTTLLEKYNVSTTGQYSKVEKEILKLEW